MTDPSAVPPTSPGEPAGTTRTLTVSLDLTRLPGVATAFGVALVGAAVVLAAVYSRIDGDLDKSNYTMGILASVGLLVLAAGSRWFVPGAERTATLVSWPGAAGILGAALMVAVGIDDDPWSIYFAGGLLLAASVIGYALTQAAPFVLTAIGGLAVLYLQVFSDVIDVDGDGENLFMILGAAVLVFVGAVTAVGWLLPKTRVLSAVVVGVGAIFAFSLVFQGLLIAGTFSAISSGMEEGFSSSSSEVFEPGSEELTGSMEDDFDEEFADDFDEEFSEEMNPVSAFSLRGTPYENDLWVMLAYSVALALFWGLCGLATGHVAFRLLGLAILVFSVPATLLSLAVNHPTWWQAALTAAGALVLAAIGYRTMKSDTAAPPAVPQ